MAKRPEARQASAEKLAWELGAILSGRQARGAASDATQAPASSSAVQPGSEDGSSTLVSEPPLMLRPCLTAWG